MTIADTSDLCSNIPLDGRLVKIFTQEDDHTAYYIQGCFIYFLTLLCSLLAQFNIPHNDIVSRGRAEENRSASSSKGHGTDLSMVASEQQGLWTNIQTPVKDSMHDKKKEKHCTQQLLCIYSTFI